MRTQPIFFASSSCFSTFGGQGFPSLRSRSWQRGWGPLADLLGKLSYERLGLHVLKLVKLLLFLDLSCRGGLSNPLTTFVGRGKADRECTIDVKAGEVVLSVDLAEHVPLVHVDVHPIYD